MIQLSTTEQVARHVGRQVRINDVSYGLFGATTRQYPQPIIYQGTLQADPLKVFGFDHPRFRLVDSHRVQKDGTLEKLPPYFGPLNIDPHNVQARRVTLIENS